MYTMKKIKVSGDLFDSFVAGDFYLHRCPGNLYTWQISKKFLFVFIKVASQMNWQQAKQMFAQKTGISLPMEF